MALDPNSAIAYNYLVAPSSTRAGPMRRWSPPSRAGLGIRGAKADVVRALGRGSPSGGRHVPGTRARRAALRLGEWIAAYAALAIATPRSACSSGLPARSTTCHVRV